MKNKIFSIGVAAILLSMIALTAPVAAQEVQGWQTMQYEPKQEFRHFWSGTLLRTENSIQFWELYSELMMMMPVKIDGDSNVEWVKMTIMWDPAAQKGEITKFEHHGMNLHFTGWTGTIMASNSLEFQVSGLGIGSYKMCALKIYGSFWGVYYPDVESNPFVSGYSAAHERATLEYCCGCVVPVGGNLLPSNGAVVPLVTLLGAIGAVTIVVGSKKKREV